MQLPLSFCVSFLSCMRVKTQSGSCCNDSPRTHFPLPQQTRLCKILLPQPQTTVKRALRYVITLHSPSILIKAPQYAASPEDGRLELHHLCPHTSTDLLQVQAVCS